MDTTNPHICHRVVTSRNGNDTVTHTWLVDNSLPKVYCSGLQYYFNFTLVKVEIVRGSRKPK